MPSFTDTADAFVTADADCVGGTTTAGGTCSSFVELTNLSVDLRTINPLLDIQLNASVVRAEATCTCAGECTATACITQTAGQAIVTIGGNEVLVGTGAQICERTEIVVAVVGVGGVIVLNDTASNSRV